MKIIINIIICFLTSYLCFSQDSKCKIEIKELRSAITHQKTIKMHFSDTVTFVYDNEIIINNRKKEIYNRWEKVKSIFRNTDFTINYHKNINCQIEIKNHYSSYILECDNSGNIVLVRENVTKLPADAPNSPKSSN